MEHKKCSASVLGALMGFNEQQAQQHAPRPRLKVLSEDYLDRMASIGVPEKKPFRSSKHKPFRMTIEDSKERINILKVEDNFKDVKHCNKCGDRMQADLALSSENMPLTRQNFANENHFSTDKMIQSSKEIQDLPRVTDSMDISTRSSEQNFVSNQIENGQSVFSSAQLQSQHTLLKSPYSLKQINNNEGTEFKERKHRQAYSSKDLDLLESFRPFLDHRYGMPSRQGRKINEMPILPCYETSLDDLNCKHVKCGPKKHACSSKDHLHSGSPLCLSRKDDRLNRLSENSQRFRCHSSSSVAARSRTRSRYESLHNMWFLKSEGPTNWLHSKPLDQNSNKNNASECTLKLNLKEFRIFPCPDSSSDHFVNDACLAVEGMRTGVERKGMFDQCSLNSPSSQHSASLCTKNKPMIREHDSASCIHLETDEDSSTNSSQATYASIKQEARVEFDKEYRTFAPYPSKELDSNMSLEEAYQPSPVSVLDPFFKEATSLNSESLKKSGISSRDLTMQLELLMSESLGTNSDGSEMVVSSDDDVGEGSVHSSEESEHVMNMFKFKDSRDFSYLVDVFTEADLHCKNMDKGCAASHSHECRRSICPEIFQTLEKKFGGQVSWGSSERKLLFDRINFGLDELFQSFVGVPDWAKPVSRRFRPLQSREMIEEELWKLFDGQKGKASKDFFDKQFGKEIGWIDLGDEIQTICREIEKFLIEELVAEFGSH